MSSIEVEVKVVGFFGDESVAVGKKVALSGGAKVSDALEALLHDGAITEPVYAQVKELQPPLYLVVNDEKVEGDEVKIELRDGDVVTVMQLMAGG